MATSVVDEMNVEGGAADATDVDTAGDTAVELIKTCSMLSTVSRRASTACT